MQETLHSNRVMTTPRPFYSCRTTDKVMLVPLPHSLHPRPAPNNCHFPSLRTLPFSSVGLSLKPLNKPQMNVCFMRKSTASKREWEVFATGRTYIVLKIALSGIFLLPDRKPRLINGFFHFQKTKTQLESHSKKGVSMTNNQGGRGVLVYIVFDTVRSGKTF